MNEQKFTNFYLQHISKKFPNVKYEPKESLVLTATTIDGKQVTHFLENAYREYLLDPNAADEVVDRYMNGVSGMYQKQEEINKSKIVPIIKPKNYFEQLQDLGKSVDDFKIPNQVWEEYNSDLIVVYAEDKEESINYFSKDEFDKLGINRKDLRSLSIENLNVILPKIDRSGEDGNYMLMAGGNYESSLILLTDIWTKDNFDVDGEIVIAIPNRDIVFVVGSNNLQQMEKMKPIVKESHDTGNHSISTKFYIWNGEIFIRH